MPLLRTLLWCAVALVALAGSAEASARPTGCLPADAYLLDANTRVSVFWRFTERYGGPGTARWRALFTCVRGEERPRRIGPYGQPPDPLLETSGIEQVQLAGNFIAYGSGFTCSRYTNDCEGRVVIRDAVRRTVVKAHRFQMFDDPSTRDDGLRIAALRISRSGAAALIIYSGVEYEVWSVRRGEAALLDRGADIDAGSLAISARRAYWVNAREVRSAPLAGTPASPAA